MEAPPYLILRNYLILITVHYLIILGAGKLEIRFLLEGGNHPRNFILTLQQNINYLNAYL